MLVLVLLGRFFCCNSNMLKILNLHAICTSCAIQCNTNTFYDTCDTCHTCLVFTKRSCSKEVHGQWCMIIGQMTKVSNTLVHPSPRHFISKMGKKRFERRHVWGVSVRSRNGSPSRHCRDTRGYGHTTTAMHDTNTPPSC